MVHKTKETDPMDEYLKNMERQLTAQQDDFKQTVKEAEATAIGLYKGVRGLGESAIKTEQAVARGVKRAKEVAKSAVRKVKGIKRGEGRIKWYQREKIGYKLTPAEKKKREREQKQYIDIRELG